MWTMLEVRHFPLTVDGFISQAREQSLEGLSQASHHCILGRSDFEDFQDRIETKAGIGPNWKPSDIRRYVQEAGHHLFDAALPGASVAGTQFGIPSVGRVGLDAEPGVIRVLATITGTVADGRILLMSKHRDHTAVEIGGLGDG